MQTSITIKHDMYHVDGRIFDAARMGGMMEHWEVSGYSFIKRVYLLRPGEKKIRVNQRMMRAAVDLCFSSNRRSRHVHLDKEEFKPMAVRKSRRKRCKVCTGVLKRNQTICDKCEALPRESRQVVGEIEPIVVIKVDTRWRWITGNISLKMDG